MTDAERYVNQSCERIVASGHVRLYRDLYRDLRERLPCGVACRLIAGGLRLSRLHPAAGHTFGLTAALIGRARAIAALKRLERYAGRQEWRGWEELARGAARGL